MANQRTTLRPTGQVLAAGWAAFPVGDGTIASHTAGSGWFTRVGASVADAQFMAPYNRLTDKGIEGKHSTSGTDYRFADASSAALGTHMVKVVANRLTSADAVTTTGSTTITSATGRFRADDIGQKITSSGGTGTGVPASSTIVTVNSPTSIDINNAVTTGGTGITLTIGDTTPGAAAVGEYLAFLWNVNTTGLYGYARFSFSGFTLATGAQIRSVRSRFVACYILDPLSSIEGNFTGPNVAVYNNPTQSGTKVFIGPNSGLSYWGTAPITKATSGGAPATVTTPSQTQTYDYTTSPTTTRAITAADVNNYEWSIATPLNSNQAGNSEIRLYALYLDVDWNAPPSALPVVANTRSQAPLVTWTYSDPEGDAQDSYRVVIFNTADLTASFDPNTASTWPTIQYDSGTVKTSTTQHQVSAGFLRPGVQYRAFVLVADAGSSGRLSRLTNVAHVSPTSNPGDGSQWTDATGTLLTQGIDFTPTGDPLLTPWINVTTASFMAAFDAVNGKIGPLYMHARPNLLSANDAALEDNGTAGVGNWTAVAGCTLSTSVTNDGRIYKGMATGTIAATGASSTLQSGAVGVYVGNGVPYMATIKLAQAQAVARRVFTLSIKWYSDAAGTALISTTAGNLSYMAQATNTFTTATVVATAPTNAVSARVFVTVTGVNAETYYFDCAGLTPYCVNCLDDGGLGNAAPIISTASPVNGGFWRFTAGASNAVNWVDDGYTATFDSNNGGLVTSTDAGKAVELVVGNNANACNIDTWAYLAGGGTSPNAKYLVSGWAKVVACSAATGTIQVGFANNTGGDITSNITNLPIGTWTRFSALLDLSGFLVATQSGTFTVRAQFTGSPATMTVRLDGLQVERVWAFDHGDMENGSLGSSIVGRCPSLGEANDWTGTNTGTNDVTYDNSTVHAGTHALKLLSSIGATTTAYQMVTVEGYSSVTFAAWMKSTTAGAGSGFVVDFYDVGGVLLSTSTIGTISGTNGSYAQSSVAVTIPAAAHYARLRISSVSDGVTTSTVWVDDVTVTPTGSLAPGTNLDGGWSAGGVLQVGAALIGETAQSQSGPWQTVRQFQGTLASSAVAIAANLNGAAFELQLNDYEFMPTRPDVAGDNYYRARMTVAVSALSTIPSSSPNSLNLNIHGIQVTNEWLLIDPVKLADNIALQVKPNGVKIETPEQLQAFVGLGRARKVVVADSVLGDEITLDLQTVLPAQHVALETQLNKQATLYLQSPDGESWYVRAVKRSRARVWQGSYLTRALRTYSHTLTEVDRTA